MNDREVILTEAIADLSRKNEYLEQQVVELKTELQQTKAMLRACRSRQVEINSGIYD